MKLLLVAALLLSGCASPLEPPVIYGQLRPGCDGEAAFRSSATGERILKDRFVLAQVDDLEVVLS